MKFPQKQKIIEISKEFNLKLLLLFGSQASGQIHQESDIDLAFLAKKDLSFDKEISLNNELGGIFKTDRVDTINLKKANPFLKYEIAKNCLLLFGTDEELFQFKSLAFREYIDHLALLELEDFLIKKRQKLFSQSIYGK